MLATSHPRCTKYGLERCIVGGLGLDGTPGYLSGSPGMSSLINLRKEGNDVVMRQLP